MFAQHAFYGFVKEVKGVGQMHGQPLQFIWQRRVSVWDDDRRPRVRLEGQHPSAGGGLGYV
jgi:hypothetical protein